MLGSFLSHMRGSTGRSTQSHSRSKPRVLVARTREALGWSFRYQILQPCSRRLSVASAAGSVVCPAYQLRTLRPRPGARQRRVQWIAEAGHGGIF